MEIKKEVSGTIGFYLVDTLGNIYSNHSGKEKRLIPSKNRKGYHIIKLCVAGSRATRTVHRIVANAFIPNPENKPQLNHKNGVKTDNRVENLEWSTSLENNRHAIDNGLIANRKGERNPNAKITEDIVLAIFKSSESTTKLSKRLSIGENTIRKIRTGECWSHVTGLSQYPSLTPTDNKQQL